MVLTARQVGKSEVAATIALRTALLQPKALVLLLNPSERQSKELMRKVQHFYASLGQPLSTGKAPMVLEMHLSNGSRIIALPESERTIRGFSGVSLLVVDEASRVADELYYAVRPMLSTSRGKLIALSTPFGKRGWFWEEWDSRRRWVRTKVLAEECRRHSPEFLAEEKQALGPRWYASEYGCSFEDCVGAVFTEEMIQNALVDGDGWFPAVDALN